MCILKILFFLLFLFPLLYAKLCQISNCGNDIPVRFPFQLRDKQPHNCGYPGFILSCNSNEVTTVVKLPYSGDFFVRDINYLTRQIYLYDADNCLPRRLLQNFNLSGSPFTAAFYHNYTFLSCPAQLTKSRFTAIDCLSNSTTSVLATSSLSLVNSLTPSCQVILTLPVPVSWPVKYDEGFSIDLNNDLQLAWSEPECGDCETRGGFCGFKSRTTQEIGCFNNPKSGKPKQDGMRIFRILCLSIAIPAFSCAVGLAICACLANRGNRQQRNTTPGAVSPQSTTVMMGLDESTIDSYQQLVLGESKRLPGPNQSTCPICLSEYHSNETLRCIPECKHCFHAQCVDEWLRLNSSCPVCRNSPSPSPAHASANIT